MRQASKEHTVKITIAAYTAQPGDLYGGRVPIARVHDTYERRVYIYLDGEDKRPLSFARSEPITIVRKGDL
jgi:hypothetical protein